MPRRWNRIFYAESVILNRKVGQASTPKRPSVAHTTPRWHVRMKDHDKTKDQLLREVTNLRESLFEAMDARQAEPRRISDLRQKAENRLRKLHSKPAEAMTDTDFRALVHELQVHQIELEMQNEELVKAQVNAQEFSEKYGDLFDFAPIGYYLWDAQGHVLEVNLSGAALLALDRERRD